MAFRQQLEEYFPVGSIGEDELAGEAAIHDMVVCMRELDAKGTTHGWRIAQRSKMT